MTQIYPFHRTSHLNRTSTELRRTDMYYIYQVVFSQFVLQLCYSPRSWQVLLCLHICLKCLWSLLPIGSFGGHASVLRGVVISSYSKTLTMRLFFLTAHHDKAIFSFGTVFAFFTMVSLKKLLCPFTKTQVSFLRFHSSSNYYKQVRVVLAI